MLLPTKSHKKTSKPKLTKYKTRGGCREHCGCSDDTSMLDIVITIHRLSDPNCKQRDNKCRDSGLNLHERYIAYNHLEYDFFGTHIA